MLRDADELLLPEVQRTIAALETTQRDAAAEQLAKRYADLIDNSGQHCTGCESASCKRVSNSWALRWIGPLLLDALESLGGTPASRGKLKEGTPAGGGNRLAALRAARRA